jgi:hypothetical protein
MAIQEMNRYFKEQLPPVQVNFDTFANGKQENSDENKPSEPPASLHPYEE